MRDEPPAPRSRMHESLPCRHVRPWHHWSCRVRDVNNSRPTSAERPWTEAPARDLGNRADVARAAPPKAVTGLDAFGHPDTIRYVLALQRTAGNAAVARLLARETFNQSPKHLPPAPPSQSGLPARSAASQVSVMREPVDDATTMCITPEFARGLSNEELESQVAAVRAQLRPGSDDAARDNLGTLEEEVSRRTLVEVRQHGPYAEAGSSEVLRLVRATGTLHELGRSPAEDPAIIAIPPGQGLAVGEDSSLALMSGDQLVELDGGLFPILEQLADASTGGPPPQVGVDGQVLLWNDGRAVSTPPMTGDLATLLINGQPVALEAAAGIAGLQRPWERVRNSAAHGLFGSGVYQLGTYPISSLNKVSLPSGTRIRFADPSFPLRTQTRVLTLFQPGTRRYYAWDAHLPVGRTPHNFWHVNQQGMHGLFAQSNHAPMTAAQIAQGRNLRYLKIGGRIFLIVGVAVDAFQLGAAGAQSIERGTPAPVIAQAVRTVGSWGGAWAGAKLGCAGAGLAGIETGPGAALFCIAGGAVGGFAGYFGADWIADMISED